MTSVPIQGEAEAPSKFWVLLTASLVSSLIMSAGGDGRSAMSNRPEKGLAFGVGVVDIHVVWKGRRSRRVAALSGCHPKSAGGLRLTDFQAAATASRHAVVIAAARSTRRD